MADKKYSNKPPKKTLRNFEKAIGGPIEIFPDMGIKGGASKVTSKKFKIKPKVKKEVDTAMKVFSQAGDYEKANFLKYILKGGKLGSVKKARLKDAILKAKTSTKQ
jgi:hypothetical protein|tara:strand:- start:171 stop:488 length:318 start_codon:yes stop_codon:yes gene_type:complete